MGYNTTVVVINDALDYIAEDPLFGKRLAEAIKAAGHGGAVDVAAHNTRGGIHCNAAIVIETHHANLDVRVRVGGNYGKVVAEGE